jgi:hypothetical protein
LIEVPRARSTGLAMTSSTPKAVSLALRLLLLPATTVAACDTEDPALSDDDIVFRPCPGCKWGPPLLNSHGLDGLEVSALDTTFAFHDGWRLAGVFVVGDGGIGVAPVTSYRALIEVHAEDGLLHGTDQWGTPVAGDEFVGSLWFVELEETGNKEVMKVIDFVADPSASRYTFIASSTSANVGTPKFYTCPKDEDTGEYSVVVFGDFDVDPSSGRHLHRPNTIFFGCTAAAIGKSAVWGYSPWATDADMHQTASRAVRADYCGDGTPYTTAGTPLQLHDRLGIIDFAYPQAETEAMWGPEGALCVKQPRFVDISEVPCAGKPVPSCSESDDLSAFKNALLWSKVSP